MAPTEEELIGSESKRVIGVADEPSIALPLLASWVALVAFVGAMASVKGPLEAPATMFRKQEIERSLNASANPCESFYNFTCGGFPAHNALTPWAKRQIISNRIVLNSGKAQECLKGDFFENDAPWLEEMQAAADLGCDVKCKLGYVNIGLEVNGVLGRIANIHGTYTMVYFTNEGEVLPQSEPADFSNISGIIRTADVKKRLFSENTTIEFAVDYPRTCLMAMKTYHLSYISNLFPPVSAKLQELSANIFNTAKNYFQANETPPTILIGGGAGLVADTHQPLNTLSWVDSKERQLALAGMSALPGINTVYETPASTVNAFFDSDSNTVHIPSAILSEPFFSDEYSRDLAYGGIGFILAHELGHAIDHARNNSGLRHGLGHLLSHMAHADYKTIKHTEDEAIADYHGLELVRETAGLTNFTALQMTQMWCLSSNQFTNDTHPPGRWRVNVTFGNSSWWKSTYC